MALGTCHTEAIDAWFDFRCCGAVPLGQFMLRRTVGCHRCEKAHQ